MTGLLRMRKVRALAIMATLVVAAAACAPPAAAPPPTPTSEGHVGTTHISLELTGASTYSADAVVTDGRVAPRWHAYSMFTLAGTTTFDGVAGDATVDFDMTLVGAGFDGTIEITDAGAGVSAVVSLSNSPVSFDNDGNSSGFVDDGTHQLEWSTHTEIADGLEPELDQLTALEADFCVDAQRSLVGVDEVALPTIVTTNHAARAPFVEAKVQHGPLGVHMWSQRELATTASGNAVNFTHRIRCKTASSDRLADQGIATSPDAQCSTLTQGSIDTARGLMTVPEKDAYDNLGRQVALQPDDLVTSGLSWLAYVEDEATPVTDLEVTARALQVDWTDPAYFGFPDDIRGVHYCTVWSPAWAYWWMTAGAFLP